MKKFVFHKNRHSFPECIGKIFTFLAIFCRRVRSCFEKKDKGIEEDARSLSAD